MPVVSLAHMAVIVALFALPIGAVAFLGGRQLRTFIVEWRRARAHGLPAARRRCRYCVLGRARMTEQTARIEADDLITTRCWVCSACGLPHWTVTRSPVLKPVSSRE